MSKEVKLSDLDPSEREKRIADRAAYEREQKIIQKRKTEAARYAFTEREKFVAGIQATEAIAREAEQRTDNNVDNDRAVARTLVMGRRAKLLRSLLGEYDEVAANLEKGAEHFASNALTKAASALAEQIAKILPAIPPDRALALAKEYGPLENERQKMQTATITTGELRKRKSAIAREIYRLLELTAVAHCGAVNPFMELCRRGGLKPAEAK